MGESYRALCSDFYLNQKLSVRLELPRTRETVLELFERVRRRFPSMSQFRRFRDELALESAAADLPQRWAAVRPTSVRSGVVNPESPTEAESLHRHLLETVPYFLSVSPLDIESLELLFGFDLECGGNHDSVIHDALLAGSPLARLLEMSSATPVECQPMLAVSLGEGTGLEAQVEVKSRSTADHPRESMIDSGEPISVYLTVRRTAPFDSVEELPEALDDLLRVGREIVDGRLVEGMLVPLRDAIGFNS